MEGGWRFRWEIVQEVTPGGMPIALAKCAQVPACQCERQCGQGRRRAYVKRLPVAAVAAAAIAARRRTRVDTCVAVPSHDPPGAERCARGDNRSADTWPRSAAWRRAPAHRARHAPSGTSRSSGAIRSTRRLGAGYAHAPSPKPPGPFGPASSPFSAVDLFQRLDRQFALGDHALELRVLRLQFAQSLHVRRLQRPESSSPHVDRLLANLVLPGHFRDRTTISFAQDCNSFRFKLHSYEQPEMLPGQRYAIRTGVDESKQQHFKRHDPTGHGTDSGRKIRRPNRSTGPHLRPAIE